MTCSYAQLLLDCFDDFSGSTESAGGRRADLEKILSNGFSIEPIKVNHDERTYLVHGVESCDFIDSHGGHFEDPRNFIHDADAGPSQLPLAEIKDRYHRSLLVLRWVFTATPQFKLKWT